ncbi:MAG: D-alanyl-D-alanine carboxypeptidase/D-alanyl-D-alanine-endopeptidase [Pseudomonadota bacterium]
MTWSTVLGAASNLPEPVASVMKQHRLPPDSISVYVRDVRADSPMVAFNDDVPRNPASVMKLVTTLAGLELLGPAFQWTTRVYANAAPKDGKVKNLYVRGGGDPFLVVERFWLLLRQVRALGVRDITGDVIVDGSYFAIPKSDPGEFDGRPYRIYNVRPSGALVNFHALSFRFQPQKKSVAISVDPPIEDLVIQNQLRLVDGPCRSRNWKLQMQVVEAKSPTVRFAGAYPRRCPKHELVRSTMSGHQYFSGLFRSLWREQGGTFAGRVKRAPVPKQAVELTSLDSLSLAELARGMNKFSNNVMTRHLLLTLGAELGGVPGTPNKGRNAIVDWLRAWNLPTRHFRIDNGAGLSRDARLSARFLGELLHRAFHSARMPEFLSTLPIVGIDGSMRRRLKDTSVIGQGHFKTGLLNDVRAIAGYMRTESGRRLGVVALQNYPKIDRGAGTEVQDALLRWLHQQ